MSANRRPRGRPRRDGLAVLTEALAAACWGERPDLENGDMTALVVRELVRCAAAVMGDTRDAGDACHTKREIS